MHSIAKTILCETSEEIPYETSWSSPRKNKKKRVWKSLERISGKITVRTSNEISVDISKPNLKWIFEKPRIFVFFAECFFLRISKKNTRIAVKFSKACPEEIAEAINKKFSEKNLADTFGGIPDVIFTRILK